MLCCICNSLPLFDGWFSCGFESHSQHCFKNMPTVEVDPIIYSFETLIFTNQLDYRSNDRYVVENWKLFLTDAETSSATTVKNEPDVSNKKSTGELDLLVRKNRKYNEK